MNYFPVGGNGKVKVDGEKVDLSKIEFLFSNYYNAQLEDIPYSLYKGSAVVVNDEIHILGGDNNSTAHYYWYRNRWIMEDRLPYVFTRGSAVVVDGEIHILGGSGGSKNHYKWDGNTWTQVSTLPYNHSSDTCVVVLDNEIHMLGGNYNDNTKRYHYKWDGNTWTQVSTLPYAFFEGMAVVHNDSLFIMGGNDGSDGGLSNFYVLNGTEWISFGRLPVPVRSGIAIEVNGEMYVFLPYSGSSAATSLSKIYKYPRNNAGFYEINVTLPQSSIYNHFPVVPFRGEMHRLGISTATGYEKQHWKIAVKNYSMVVHQ